MSELALYRKYRSASFDDLIGQDHVVKTLKSALAKGRISHAYLLTGPRGVGKTSVARLLARAVNCLEENPAKRPCGSCEICQIPLGSNFDIIEIDAASNRKIDEMRDLRDKINLAPARSRYKVYIIDEVHMLTTEAFNALLKTLEEPPPHAIFILATTEAHKLPETIISRTQRFSFNAISMENLTARLRKIAETEKISIEPEAIKLIATTSRGGFRDAISMLDQVANTEHKLITEAAVRELLGLSPIEALASITRAIAGHNPKLALDTIDTLDAQGISSSQLTLQLINYFRDLLLDKLQNKADIHKLSEIELAEIIDALCQVPLSAMPDLTLETTIVRLSLPTLPAKTRAQPTETTLAQSQTPTAPAEQPRAEETNEAQPPELSDSPTFTPTELWPKTLILIKAKNNSLHAILGSCQIEITGKNIIITSPFSFHLDRLKEPKNREIIESALEKTYGHSIALVTSLAAKKTSPSINPGDELVSSALEILGGEIVE
ncbi:MAG: DNA polymerase III subunit gamma/tau [Candidatus Saccharimonadia bacterium]